MAATRRMNEMVENNRHLQYITNAQLTKLRADIKTARKIALDEFERLDSIIKHGSLTARANLDVEALRTLYDALHPDERRELLAETTEPPPNDTAPLNKHMTHSAICVAFVAGVISAITIANALA